MDQNTKIPASDEAWDQGTLGRERAHARKVSLSPDQHAHLDDGLDLQMISIRLPKSLIEDLKLIGRHHGLGYQPLVRQTLTRFAHSELKQFARERMQEEEAPQREKRVA
jgi:hypothetical protein